MSLKPFVAPFTCDQPSPKTNSEDTVHVNMLLSSEARFHKIALQDTFVNAVHDIAPSVGRLRTKGREFVFIVEISDWNFGLECLNMCHWCP